MKPSRAWRLSSLWGLAASLLAPFAASAGEPAAPSFDVPAHVALMPVGPRVEAPYGFVDFCARTPAPCERRALVIADIALTPAHKAALIRVNNEVNALPQISDRDNYGVTEYWAYPNAKGGDCEDLALEKQRRLVALGFPESALLLAVVRQKNGEGHTVLVVETDRGEFVLDNLERSILAWSDVSYTWRKRQSRLAAGRWQSVDPGATAVAEASGRDRREATSAPLPAPR